MNIGTLRYACKYPNCTNKFYSDICNLDYKNKHFFKFPSKHEDICKRWKNICGIEEGVNCKNFHVCEDHFLPSDFQKCSKSLLFMVPFLNL